MNKRQSKAGFDHGEFWDQYSAGWERRGDGTYLPKGGGKDVLGNEWGDDGDAAALIDAWIRPHVKEGGRTLEIGPGGGKFSRILDRFSSELVLADISSAMLERGAAACARKPALVHIDGASLRPLTDGSFDLVFSYDVFIHLESEEIFRYLAEVNRVLKPGGVFLVHTSTFESRFGMLAYFRQIRDQQPEIGTRYGGRMYPMTLSILHRFAEHSGFSVVRSHGDWSDRNIVFLLRKSHPAWLWRFATTPGLRDEYELCERVGGSGRRGIYYANALKSGEVGYVLLGDACDPYLVAASKAKVPSHPCLASPAGYREIAGVGIVSYPPAYGPSFTRVLAGEEIVSEVPRPPWKLVADLFEAIDVAHAAGLVHGEISPASMILHVPESRLWLMGLVDPAAAGIRDVAAVQRDDRARLAALMDGMAVPAEQLAEVREATRRFTRE